MRNPNKNPLPETQTKDNFSLFLEDLHNEGEISPEEYEKILASLEKKEVKELLKLAVKIEIGYIVVALPAAIYISLDDVQQALEDPASLARETLFFVLAIKIFRALLALTFSAQIKLPNKVLFSLLEAVPHVGRAAPALWLLPHGKLGEYFYLYQKVKKSRKNRLKEDNLQKIEEMKLNESKTIESARAFFEKIQNVCKI